VHSVQLPSDILKIVSKYIITFFWENDNNRF